MFYIFQKVRVLLDLVEIRLFVLLPSAPDFGALNNQKTYSGIG